MFSEVTDAVLRMQKAERMGTSVKFPPWLFREPLRSARDSTSESAAVPQELMTPLTTLCLSARDNSVITARMSSSVIAVADVSA